MTQGVKNGYLARMLTGKDRGGSRTAVKVGRWAYVLDQVRGRFSKLVLFNLLMLVFCIPLAVFFVLRYANVLSGGQSVPFSGWMFVGFPAYPSLAGSSELIALGVDRLFGALMVVALLVAVVGVAGGLNVVRGMIRTSGDFSLRDFWKGIAANAKYALPAAAVCGILAYLFVLAIDYARYLLAVGQGSAGWLIAGIVVSVIALVLLAFIFLWTLAVGANYKVSFFGALKSSVFLTFRLFPLNLFYAILVVIPLVLLFLGSFIQTVGFALMILFGVMYMVIVWMNYAQWAFDRLVGEAAGTENAAQPVQDAAANKVSKEYEESLEAAMRVKSDLASRPIKPITDDAALYELPAAFTRSDLHKLRDSKVFLEEDARRYAEEHKNDEKYVVYNAQFEKLEQERLEREREAQKAAKKKKKRGEDAQ